MPKETFFNLPEDKRTQVFQAAVEEFAAHPFAQASVNRIVARAGIAKGSFYQYFENKQDLYLYVLERLGAEKAAYLAPLLAQAGERNFFDLLRNLYAAGIRFAVEHPDYAAIGRLLLAKKHAPMFSVVMQPGAEASLTLFRTLLQEGIRRGEVRPEVDTRLFAYLIAEMHTLLLEYYTEHVSAEYDARLMDVVEQFIGFLRFGLEAQE